MTTTPDTTQPLPCPFCGGEAALEPEGSGMDTEENWSVYCFAEECPSTPCVVEAGMDNAIAAWNTRHPTGGGR